MRRLQFCVTIITFCLTAFNSLCSGKRNLKIHITSINYKMPQMGYFAVEQFSQGINSARLSILTMQLRILRNMSNIRFRDTFDMLRKDNSHIRVMNLDVDGCPVLDGSTVNKFVKITIDELLRVSQPPLLCPLLEGTVHKISNFTVRPQMYPDFIPIMNWMEIVRIGVDKQSYLQLIFSGSVR